MKTKVFVVLFWTVSSAAPSAAFTLESQITSVADSSGKCLEQCRGEGLLAMFWNLENFFDYKDDGGGESDKEFTAEGLRRWTKSRFYAKCDAVAKTIFWTQDQTGRLPDVIGLAEVENRFVLNSILSSTLLKKTDYEIVHFDSQDPRGIDVALLYRAEVFRKVSAKPCRIYDSTGNQMRTRDILCVELCRTDNGRTVYFLVNHHPSKFGGTSASQGRRALAMERLKEICDSLVSVMPETEEAKTSTVVSSGIQPGEYNDAAIVAMGDFNDTPDSGLFSIFDGKMSNLADGPFRRGEGTIRYAGKWDLIDMFLVSVGIADDYVQKILYPPFLMTNDRTHGGLKPLRTYVGPRFESGISDHCPIILRCRPE